MARTPVGGGVQQTLTLHSTRVIGGHLQFLGTHGEFRDAVLCGEAVAAFGHLAAQVPAIGDIANGVVQQIGSSEPQVRVDEAALGHLHCAADGAASRNGIETQVVAQIIRLGDRFQVVDAALCSKRPGRFVFRAFSFALFGLGDSRAGNRTGPAGLLLDQDGLAHALAADVLGPFELALLEIAGRQGTDFVDDVHHDRSAEFRQCL